MSEKREFKFLGEDGGTLHIEEVEGSNVLNIYMTDVDELSGGILDRETARDAAAFILELTSSMPAGQDVFVLCLNDMRYAKFEVMDPIAFSENVQDLHALLERETVETYREPGVGHHGPTQWAKSFRKGGPLEWRNQLQFDGIRTMSPDELDGLPHAKDLGVDAVSREEDDADPARGRETDGW